MRPSISALSWLNVSRPTRRRDPGRGWGAFLSCVLFGFTHTFDPSHGHYSFDAIMMALTKIPSFLAAWIRLRARNLLLPALFHNFGNSISPLI
ncbi:CPBP family glutamic-type intramembrane protease [Asticcacaulis excentricus]|uniref:CPBP family glutamic-type intramembrane protease n=1 Tax=Asticcacaulis excentricus TaxID=78587 RepID=UPI003CCB7126